MQKPTDAYVLHDELQFELPELPDGGSTEDAMRLATDTYLRTYAAAFTLQLRKLKARSMVKAVQQGTYESGNHRTEYKDGSVVFSYRDTVIMTYNVHTQELQAVDAGAFEQTPATRRQRAEIRDAVAEFKKVVGRL